MPDSPGPFGADEATLLKASSMPLDTPAEVLMDNLLLRMHSGPFLAKMIQWARPRHQVFDGDPEEPVQAIWGEATPRLGGVWPETEYRSPPSFPPIGVYQLVAETGYPAIDIRDAKDVLLSAEPYQVYYRRTLVPAGGSVQIPRRYVGRSNPVDPSRYIAAAAGVSQADVSRLFFVSTTIRWTKADEFENQVHHALAIQEAGLRKLVELAKKAGFQNLPPSTFTVRVVVHHVPFSDPTTTPFESTDRSNCCDTAMAGLSRRLYDNAVFQRLPD